MTDTSKYRNISIDLKTYDLLKEQSKSICDVDLSISQVVRHNATITQSMLESPSYVTRMERETVGEIFASSNA